MILHKRDNEEYFIGLSKEDYSSLEEAMEGCKEDPVAIYSDNGELEEYQEAITKCEYRNDDEESYYFYQEDVYTYKECREVN